MKVVENEDELASVIAHEVSHVKERHVMDYIEDRRKAKATEDTLKTLGKIAAIASGNSEVGMAISVADAVDSLAGDVVWKLVDSGFSQEQEYEADAEAVKLLIQVGYSPESLIRVLEKLEAKANKSAGFMKTHPLPKDRMDRLKAAIGDVKIPVDPQRTKRFKDIQNTMP